MNPLLLIAIISFWVASLLFVAETIESKVEEQIQIILQDDKANSLCAYWIDNDDYEHGCLTDVQLESVKIIQDIVR
jgi:hypothetical protein